MLETSRPLSQYSWRPAVAPSSNTPARQRYSSCSVNSFDYQSLNYTPYQKRVHQSSCLPTIQDQPQTTVNSGLQVEFFDNEADARLRSDQLHRATMPDESHPLVCRHSHDESSTCCVVPECDTRPIITEKRGSILIDRLSHIKRPKFSRTRSTSLPIYPIPPQRASTPESVRSRSTSLTSGWDDSDDEDEEMEKENNPKLHRRFSSRVSCYIGKLTSRSTQ